MNLTTEQKESKSKIYLEIKRDVLSGEPRQVIADKYGMTKSNISHILRRMGVAISRPKRTGDLSKCKNHPDRDAIKGRALCIECQRTYKREYIRAYRHRCASEVKLIKKRDLPKYTPQFIREELPERLERIRQKYREMSDKEILTGVRVHIGDFDYAVQPKYNHPEAIWK